MGAARPYALTCPAMPISRRTSHRRRGARHRAFGADRPPDASQGDRRLDGAAVARREAREKEAGRLPVHVARAALRARCCGPILSPLIGVALRKLVRRQTGVGGVGHQQACQRLAGLIRQAAPSGSRIRRRRHDRQEQIQLSMWPPGPTMGQLRHGALHETRERLPLRSAPRRLPCAASLLEEGPPTP